MGLRPKVSRRKLFPVFLSEEEKRFQRDPTIQSTPIVKRSQVDWRMVLNAIGEEAYRVYQLSEETSSESSPWFERLMKGDHRVYNSMMNATIKVSAWENLYPANSIEESLIQAGRYLCRLLPSIPVVYREPRRWFIESRTPIGWFSPLSALENSDWGELPINFFAFYDELMKLFALVKGNRWPISRSELIPFSVSPPCLWSIRPFQSLFQVNRHWKGVLLDCIQRQRDCAKHEPTWNWKFDSESVLTKQLAKIDIHQLPKVDEGWKVDVILHLGLPGGVKVPDHFLFGLDFGWIEQPGLRLLAFEGGGNAIYQDWKGKILSEGFPLERIPAVQAWGKGIQIRVDKTNFYELLPYWKNPPAKCPWSWYERWGNRIYKADGSAVNPDPVHRPGVIWLEQLTGT